MRAQKSLPIPAWTQWRSQRLRVAGFPPQLAQELAREERIDVHEVLELLDRGCPPDLAARIVAPVEDVGPA